MRLYFVKLFISISFIAYAALAQSASYEGNIVLLRNHGASSAPAGMAGYSWFQIEDLSIQGCVSSDEGLGFGNLAVITIAPEDKELYSLILSAFLAENGVIVRVDPQVIYNSFCRAQHITLRH